MDGGTVEETGGCVKNEGVVLLIGSPVDDELVKLVVSAGDCVVS